MSPCNSFPSLLFACMITVHASWPAVKMVGKRSLRPAGRTCDHLMKAFVGNSYPRSFITQQPGLLGGKREAERPLTVHLPYVSGPTLCSLLTKVKDPSLWRSKHRLRSTGHAHLVKWSLKEHKDACIKGFTDKSAIAEHAWMEEHCIRCDDTRILQHATRTTELVAKETISILTSLHFNRNGIPDCWITMYLKVEPVWATSTRPHHQPNCHHACST